MLSFAIHSSWFSPIEINTSLNTSLNIDNIEKVDYNLIFDSIIDYSFIDPSYHSTKMSATQFTCKNGEVSPESLISSNAVNSSKNSRKNDKRVLFPVKLYNILTHIASKDPNVAIAIGWDPHGRSFRVNRSRLFEKFVLPKYFNMTKMKSFIRQLNLYNFTRITAGKDEGSYYHVNFLRGHLEHVVKVRREKTRGAPGKCLFCLLQMFLKYPHQ